MSCTTITRLAGNVKNNSKLRERARWTKSCIVIGYPRGQDGSFLITRPGTARCIPHRNSVIISLRGRRSKENAREARSNACHADYVTTLTIVQ